MTRRPPRALRVVAVVQAPLDDLERAVPAGVRAHLAETPAGVVLTLECDQPWWSRRAAVRRLQLQLAETVRRAGR